MKQSAVRTLMAGHYAKVAAVGLVSMLSVGLPSASADVNLSSTGGVSPNRVVPGGLVLIDAAFQSSIALDDVNVALEVHNAADTRVFQQVIPRQTFAAGDSHTYSARWSVPRDLTPGLYSVQAGVFSSDWSISYAWNDAAAAITVANSLVGLDSVTYFIDCNEGNDRNSGTGPGRAWATLAPANDALLQPGDVLRLKRDCAWTGPLTAGWSGTEAHPITVEAYGSGSLPLIQNADFAQVAVSGSFVVFDALHLRASPALLDDSCKNNPVGYRLGFFFGPGSINNVVKNSVVEDTGAGVDIGPGSSGNLITHNEFLNNNMMWDVDPWANDGGADGILIEGDSNDVSFNHVAGSVACSRRYPADGSAFELSGGTNNRIHHNLADNNWIFAELSQSTSNDFAYNVSTTGGFTNHTDSLGTRLYNNVFYAPGGGVVSCYPCQDGGLLMVNNIFFADIALYAQGTVGENHNVFWRTSDGAPSMTQPKDKTSIVADPQFVDPAHGNFHVLASSPALNAGSPESVQAGYATDLDGAVIPPGRLVDIGVYEH